MATQAAPAGSARPAEATGDAPIGMRVESLSAYYGSHTAIENVDLVIEPGAVTAIIGPSGCGKSTLIRCLNRIHEVVPGARAEGRVLLGTENIYGRGVDPVAVRRRIGMVFQKANPFPMMSVYDNVAAGLRLNGLTRLVNLDEVVERSLRQAALWDEVKDKLKDSGASLSGGQQQRLCIARSIAVEPDVLLMDEPCSALDPIATYRIEELIRDLKCDFTIVIVTHNMQQASRISDNTAFMLAAEERIGRLVELGPTRQIFTTPRDRRTEEYITGRFG